MLSRVPALNGKAMNRPRILLADDHQLAKYSLSWKSSTFKDRRHCIEHRAICWNRLSVRHSVIRDRPAGLEDRFFAPVVFGGGVPYVAITFTGTGNCGRASCRSAQGPDRLTASSVYFLLRADLSIYEGLLHRMTAVLITSSTIFGRTLIVPR